MSRRIALVLALLGAALLASGAVAAEACPTKSLYVYFLYEKCPGFNSEYLVNDISGYLNDGTEYLDASINSATYCDYNAFNTGIFNALNWFQNTMGAVDARRVFVIFRSNRGNIYQPRISYLQTMAKDRMRTMGGLVATIDALNNLPRGAAVSTDVASHPGLAIAFPGTYPVSEEAEYYLGDIVSAVRGEGRKCLFFGGHHVQTYNGKFYHDLSIGDYTLARFSMYESWSFGEVQVRNEPCPDGEGVCLTGVAVRNSEKSIVFRYDAPSNTLLASADGEQLEEISRTTSWGNWYQQYYDLFVTRREPSRGYNVSIDDGNVKVTVIFNGASSFVIVDAGADNFEDSVTDGLCGTYDYCSENDFVTRDGKVVTSARLSARTWRIDNPALSAFDRWQLRQYDMSFNEYPLYTRSPFFAASDAVVSLPESLSEGSQEHCDRQELGFGFLHEACRYDYDTDSRFNLPELQRALCSLYCPNHFSAIALLDADPSTCASVCDDVMAAIVDQPFFELSGEYDNNATEFFSYTSEENQTALPKLNVAVTKQGSHAVFFPPMGGEYVFEVTKEDCCSVSDPATVTVSVTCSKDFEVKAGDDMEFTIDEYLFPEVMMSGSSSPNKTENSIHHYWRFVTFPGDVAPELHNEYSLKPHWKPNHVGVYTLELVGFDGCSVAYDRVDVEIKCLDVAWSVRHSGAIAWSGANPSFSSYYAFINRECPTPLPEKEEVNVDSFTAKPKRQFKLVPNPAAATQYILTWGLLANNNTEIRTYSTEFNIPAPNSTSYTPLKSSGNFGVVRVEATNYLEYEHFFHFENVTEYEESYDHAEYTDCTFHFSQGFSEGGKYLRVYAEPNSYTFLKSDIEGTFLENVTEAQYLASRNKWGFGDCTGEYSIDFTVADELGCNNHSESLNLTVSCDGGWYGPIAHTLFPCFSIPFDYVNKNFPEVTLDGRDSSDYRTESISVLWEGVSAPEYSEYYFANTNQMEAAFRADREGVYKFDLYTTNMCRQDKESMEVEAVCLGDVVANLFATPSVVQFNYTHPSQNRVLFNASLSSTAAPTEDLYFDWAIVAFPTLNVEGAPDAITHGAANLFSIEPHGNGKHTVQVTVTDKCRTAAMNVSVTVSCPNVIDARILPSATVLTYDPTIAEEVTLDASNSDSSLGYDLTYSWTIEKEMTAENGTVYYELKDTRATESFTWNPSVSDSYYGPGKYRVSLMASDGCKTDKAATTDLTLKCDTNVITPVIDVNQSTWQLDVNLNIELNATLSSMGDDAMPRIFKWTVTNPAGAVSQLGNSGSEVVSFHPDAIGNWVVSLVLSDGCKEKEVTRTIRVVCPCSVVPAIATKQRGGSTQVKFDGKRFPLVCVDADGSTYSFTTWESYDATWTFLATPQNSVFKGRNQPKIITEIRNTTSTTSSVSGFHYVTKTVNSTITKKYKITEYSVLNQVTADSRFGSCFRPDAPGTYQLELALAHKQYDCASKAKTVNITAVCNDKPVLRAEIPSNATAHQMVWLDASGTSDANHDVLRYIWTLSKQDVEDEEPVDVSSLLFGNKLARAGFLPKENTTYYVTLSVSDGCTTVNDEWTIASACKRELKTPDDMWVRAEFDGTRTMAVHMDLPANDNIKHANNNPFLYTHRWTLVDYKATEVRQYGVAKEEGLKPGAKAGIAVGVIVGSIGGAAIIGGAIAVGVYFILKGGSTAPAA